MTRLVSFPSGHIRIEYTLLLTDQSRMRTMNDHGDLVVDGFYIVVDAGHSFVDTGHSLVDASYLIEHPILDHPHSIIDSMRGVQNLRRHHPDLFIRQLVQPLQRIFNVSLSNQLLQVFFWRIFLINSEPVVLDLLTRTALLQLLRSDAKNRKHLDHNLYNDIYHFGWRRHPSVDFKTLEKILHALEDVDKSILACTNIHSCLRERRHDGPREGIMRDTH